MQSILTLFYNVRNTLFPVIEKELSSALTEKEQLFVNILVLCEADRFLVPYCWCGNGRKPHSRHLIFNLLVLKAVMNFGTTKQALATVKACPRYRLLCGWEHASEVPDESVVSRAFGRFAEAGIADRIHAAMIKSYAANAHTEVVARDSVPVKVRESVAKQELAVEPKQEQPKKRGRPRKGEERPPPPPSNIEVQASRSLAENLALLPQECGWGVKRNGQGIKEKWKGYKLHADVAMDGVPLVCQFSSASMHDSQCDIPLTQAGLERFIGCIQLKDAAYDAAAIRKFSADSGLTAIIDRNKRSGENKAFSEVEAEIYKGRSGAERLFSHLGNHGLNNVRVRGYAKVTQHVMFGVLVVTTFHLIRRVAEMLC